MNKLKVILIHGNGGATPNDYWLPSVKHELEALGITVVSPLFPDASLARASYWLPYLKDELRADENTIIIGHSSGAVATMRFAEQNKIWGSVLVAAMYTDLDMDTEKLSGYYDAPWNWDAIKKNQQWIAQFASIDDPWIPIREARYVHEKLHTKYYEYKDQGHFGSDCYKKDFPEIVQLIKDQLAL